MRLDSVSLRLKCNAYNLIASGTKIQMATRLQEFLNHPPPDNGQDDESANQPSRSPSELEDGEIDERHYSDVGRYGYDDDLEMQSLLDYNESGGELSDGENPQNR